MGFKPRDPCTFYFGTVCSLIFIATYIILIGIGAHLLPTNLGVGLLSGGGVGLVHVLAFLCIWWLVQSSHVVCCHGRDARWWLLLLVLYIGGLIVIIIVGAGMSPSSPAHIGMIVAGAVALGHLPLLGIVMLCLFMSSVSRG